MYTSGVQHFSLYICLAFGSSLTFPPRGLITGFYGILFLCKSICLSILFLFSVTVCLLLLVPLLPLLSLTLVTALSSNYSPCLILVLYEPCALLSCLPSLCTSHAMTSAECNDAQIEKEALALTWSCDRFSHYMLGPAVFTMEKDHKPLVPIFSTKLFHSLPARVLRFHLRLARYHFNIIHVPGKYLHSADALSQAPDQLQPGHDVTELSAEADSSASSVQKYSMFYQLT